MACLAVVMVGCTTYNQQNKFGQHWQSGRLAMAEKEAKAATKKHANDKDAIIWRLEEGAILRAEGKYEESNGTLQQAQERINQYEEEAKTKLGNEAAAFLSNQANLPYRGRAYDGIMANTYRALNYLALGQPDNARVELIRAYQRQQDAVEENKKRIEKTQDALDKQKEKEKIKKAEQNPRFKSQMSSNFGDLDHLKVYGDYVNPFTVYLDGLFFLFNATGGSDLERARKSLERVVGFAEGNAYVKTDLEAAEGVIQGQPMPPTTYVIFETGCAPIRDQIRIDIPILVANVSYVGAAFPKLKPQPSFIPSLTVTAGGKSETTATVANMDNVIGLDFKNELPSIITKTVAATVVKAAAAYAMNEAARQTDGTVHLASKLLTAAYQASVNIADCRTWTTLPKEFQVCRVPTPADRKIELATAGGGQRTTVTLGEGTFTLVYVKSINATSPLLVSQMKFK